MTPTLFLMSGMPGAGKTTRARELAAEHPAVRFSPDEWMVPLFDGPEFDGAEPDGARDVLEGRMLWTAAALLRIGTSVVLDFGLWGRDERSALRWFGRHLGAHVETVILPIDPETQFERVIRRSSEGGAQGVTASLAQTDPASVRKVLERWRTYFQEPDADELAGIDAPVPPDGSAATWSQWISLRWPTAGDIAADEAR